MALQFQSMASLRGTTPFSTSSRPSPSLPFSIPFRPSPSLVRLPSLILRRSPRCGVASDDGASLSSVRSSSLSALEALKTSAADRYTKERSSIVSVGLSVHTTPVEIREKLTIAETDWRRAVEELCNLNHIEEAAVLSTCNRLEIYVLALSQHRGVKEVTEWMSKSSGVAVSELIKHRVFLYNKDAVEHLFEVSSGLDSLVLGEGQILAQVKQVVKVGQGVRGFGRNMSGLFKHAISVGKRVRSETGIAEGSVSVSSAAVELALKKLAESSSGGVGAARMLVVGAGEMGKMVIKHLVAKGCRKMVVVNRSEARVAAIREEMKEGVVEMIYKPLSELYDCAAAADVIFTCTSSESPLYLKEHVENLAPEGLRLFFDISVPRNVGSCVGSLETARVFNVDDLKEVVEANKEDRLRKATNARAIIDEETKRFEDRRDSLQTVPTIKKLRACVERKVMAEMEKFCSRGDHSKAAINDCARSIANKLLQSPMQHLRCDGSENRPLSEALENMHALNRMFDLEAEEIAILKHNK